MTSSALLPKTPWPVRERIERRLASKRPRRLYAGVARLPCSPPVLASATAPPHRSNASNRSRLALSGPGPRCAGAPKGLGHSRDPTTNVMFLEDGTGAAV